MSEQPSASPWRVALVIGTVDSPAPFGQGS